MEQPLQLMPAKCGRCGSVFDLRYDLDSRGDERVAELIAALFRVQKRMLCWNCRD